MFAGCRPDLTWLQKVTSQNLGSATFCDQCTRKHGPCCNHSTGPLSIKPGCSASIDLTPQGQPTNDAPVMRTLPGLAARSTGLTYHDNQPTNDLWYLEHPRREDSPSPPPSPEYDNNVFSLAEVFEGHDEEDSLSPASVYMDCLEELSPSPSAGSPQADSPPDSPPLFIVESDEGEQFSELRLSPFPVFLECEQCNNYCCSPLGERIETSPEHGGKIKSSSEKWQEIEKVPEFKKNIELSPNSEQTFDVSPEPEPQIELSREHETLKGPSNLWQEIASACEPSQIIEQSPDHKQEVEFNSDSCQVFEEPLQWTEQSKEPQKVLQLPLPPKQTVEQCLQDIELPHESMSTEPEQQIEFFFKTHQIIEMSSEPMIGLSPEHRPAVEPPLEPRISSTETQQNDLQQITMPSPEPGTVSKAPTEPWPETESSFGPWHDIEPFSEYNQGTEVSPNSWQIFKESEVSQPQQLTELSTDTQGEFKLPSDPMKRNEVCTEQRLGVELNPDSWQGFAISTDSKQQNKPSMETQGVFKVPLPPRQRAKWSSGCMQLIQLSHEPIEGIDLPTNDVQMFEAFSGPKQNIEVSSKSHIGTELSHDHRQGIYLSPEHKHCIEPGQETELPIGPQECTKWSSNFMTVFDMSNEFQQPTGSSTDPQIVFRLPPESMLKNELCQEAELNTDSWQVFTASNELNQEIETAKDLQEVFKRHTKPGQRTEQSYGCMQGFELSSESTHTINPCSSKPHQGNELSPKYRQGIESSEHEQGIETSFGTKLSIESQEWTEQSQRTKLSTEENSTLLPGLKLINEKCPELNQEVELTPDSLQVFEVSNEPMKMTESTTESHGVFKVPLPPKRLVRRFSGYIQGSELSHESMQIIDSFANSGQIWNMSIEPKHQTEVSTRLNQGTESSPEPYDWIERSPSCCQIFEMSNECQQMTKSSTETEEEFKLPTELKQNTELSSKHKQGYELTTDSRQVSNEPHWLEPAKEIQGVFKMPLPPRKKVVQSQKCMQGIVPSGQVFMGSAKPQQQIEVSSQPHQGTKLSPKPRQETEHEERIQRSLEFRHGTEIPIEPQTSNVPEKLDVSTEPQKLTLGEFKLLSTLRQKTGSSSELMKRFEVTSDSKQDTELFETQQQIEIGLELQEITEMYHSLKCDSEPSTESLLQTGPSTVLEVFPEHSTEPTPDSLQRNELSSDRSQGIDPANEPMQGIGSSLEFQKTSDNTVSERPLHSPPPSFDFSSSPPPPIFFCDVKPYNDLRLTPSSPSHDEEFDEAESLGTTWSPEFMASEQPELAEEDSHISIQSHGPMQRVKRLTPYPYTIPRAIEHHENEDRDKSLYTVNPADLPDTSGGSRNLPEILELEAEDADYDSDNKEEGFCCNGRTQSPQLAGTSGNARSPRHQAPGPQHANTTKSKQVFFRNVQIHSKLVKSTTQTSYDHKPTVAQGRKRSRKSSHQEEINDKIEMSLRRSTVARRNSTIFSHSQTPKPCSTVSRHQSDYGEEDDNCCSRSSKSQRLNNPTLMILYSGEAVPSYMPNFLPTPGRLSPTLEDSTKISCSSHAQGPSLTRNRSGMMMKATLNPPAESENDKTEEEKVKRTTAPEDKDSDA